MSQTTTATVTASAAVDNNNVEGVDESKSKKKSALRGRLALVPVYDGSRVIENKKGKEIHRTGRTIQKWAIKHYRRNPTGATLKLARVTNNFRGALEGNRKTLEPLVKLNNVAMTRGAAEANLIVMDELFNAQLARQAEMCHNYRTNHTSQLTCDIVTRSYNTRGFYLRNKK